jgi:hypothetical protein
MIHCSAISVMSCCTIQQETGAVCAWQKDRGVFFLPQGGPEDAKIGPSGFWEESSLGLAEHWSVDGDINHPQDSWTLKFFPCPRQSLSWLDGKAATQAERMVD